MGWLLTAHVRRYHRHYHTHCSTSLFQHSHYRLVTFTLSTNSPFVPPAVPTTLTSPSPGSASLPTASTYTCFLSAGTAASLIVTPAGSPSNLITTSPSNPSRITVTGSCLGK